MTFSFFNLPLFARPLQLPIPLGMDPLLTAGDIRFHDEGYVSDGLYLQKFDWMIEALSR